jgi:predicted component of type VI protein secretion system
MSQESLRELLARIHERLGEAGSVDAESRDLLTTVMRDIERTLARGGVSAAVTSPAAATPRLEALAVQFEADHPGIAQLLRQIIDALQKAGI